MFDVWSPSRPTSRIRSRGPLLALSACLSDTVSPNACWESSPSFAETVSKVSANRSTISSARPAKASRLEKVAPFCRQALAASSKDGSWV